MKYSDGCIKKNGPSLRYGDGKDDHFRVKDFHSHYASLAVKTSSSKGPCGIMPMH